MTAALAGALLALAAAGPASLEQAALAAATARVAAPDRFEVDSWRIVPPGAPADAALIEGSGPDAAGTVRLVFAGNVRATVHGTVRGPALVARRALPAGAPIDPRAVELADADLTRLAGPPLRDRAQVAGLVPRRTLGAGRVLSEDALAPAPLVRRGDPVELLVEAGRLLVRAAGIARQDGAVGDVVAAQNAATGTELLARVRADGSLLVLRAAEPGSAGR